MKAIAIHEFCDNVTQLQVSSLPKPQPTDDEILVKVMSVGLNFVDTLYVWISYWTLKLSMDLHFPLY